MSIFDDALRLLGKANGAFIDHMSGIDRLVADEVIERAARAIIIGTDYEASFYEGQVAVERWAIDALELALAGDLKAADALLNRFEHAPWDHDECPMDADHDTEDPLHRRWYDSAFDGNACFACGWTVGMNPRCKVCKEADEDAFVRRLGGEA